MGIRMLGEILLKMVSVLTPDDVRQMKAGGCSEGMRQILSGIDRAANRSQFIEGERLDIKVWNDIQGKLDELWWVRCVRSNYS